MEHGSDEPSGEAGAIGCEEPSAHGIPAGAPCTGGDSDRSSAPPDTILRFLVTERLLHWAIAVPFLGCVVSAAVLLVVYNPDPTRAYRPVFAWMHRGCGAGLILFPTLVLLASGRGLRMHLYNIRQGWVWTFDDVKWLVLMGLATLSKRIVLPDQGKFNAAEKLNFMMVMVFSPLFILTGLLIWFPDFTALDPFGPWMVHCGLAALAVPLILGHMFMATINPDTRVGLTGMFSGFVSREWAAHHYARWFREQFPDLVQASAGGHSHDATAAEQAVPTPEVDATAGVYDLVDAVDDGGDVACRILAYGRAAQDDEGECDSPDEVSAVA